MCSEPSLRVSVGKNSEDSVRQAVCLGRNICQMATQVSQGRLSRDGNLAQSKGAKAGSISFFSKEGDLERGARRSFLTCRESLTGEVSEKLPEG